MSWIGTYKCKKVDPWSPDIDRIDIEDIAHALSRQPRFGGHTKGMPYSVAQHSYYTSKLVPDEHALWGLLHDASEAYLVDLPRPIKKMLPGYLEAENKLMEAICKRFGLPLAMPGAVRIVDDMLLVTEARDLFDETPEDWHQNLGHKFWDQKIVPWDYQKAEQKFLARFDELNER